MKRKHEIVLDGMDMLLLAGVATASGILVILCFSTIWAWVHLAMNVRRWSPGIWVAITLVAFAGLLWLRLRQHYRDSQEGAVIGPSLANAKASEGPRTSLISWLLIGTVLLVFVGLFFSASSPSRWRWFVHMLDVRSWTLWVWAGFGAAVLALGSCAVVFARNWGDDESPRLRPCGLDLLLAVVAIGLGMQVFRPMLASQEDRIRPGAQVRQQYIPINNGGKFALEEINYLLYLPRGYTTDQKWPLLVFLHGAGERGDDVEFVRQAELPKLIERGRFFLDHRPNSAAPRNTSRFLPAPSLTRLS